MKIFWNGLYHKNSKNFELTVCCDQKLESAASIFAVGLNIC